MSASNNFFKKPWNASIKKRIYLSFSLLVALFVINGIITIITLNKSDRLSTHLSKVLDPTLESLEDFRKMMQQSDIYTTNSVFFAVRVEDKMLLEKLHTQDYPALKSRINIYSSKWQMSSWVDSLNRVFTGFEELLAIEKSILENLNDTKETERGVEEEVIPRGDKLRASLKTIHSHWLSLRTEENETVERSSKNLKLLIISLAATITLLGIFLSLYMARVIINPIHKIRHIVNDLGKGIIKKVDHKANSDEIGEMVRSVNNLSEKLQGTAAFATEIGNRNFTSYFEPLGMKDTLGKALIAMRDNLKKSDESLNEAQHIAKLGSWDWDLVTNELFWSDEVYNIFEIDPGEFNPSYEGYLSFVHPEDREYANSVVTKCLEDHLPFSYECIIISNKNVTKILCVQGKISKNDKEEIIKLTGIAQDITERKKAEKKLEDVNRELSTLFNSIDEVFFSVDMVNCKVIQISSTCEKLYGYKASDFMANYRLWFKIIHPDDLHIIENEDDLMQDGEVVNNQYRIIRTDNTIRWVETKITPTLDKERKLIRVDGVTRDITERKIAEKALSLAQFTVENATHAIYWIKPDGSFYNINNAASLMLGYTFDELMQMSVPDIDPFYNKEVWPVHWEDLRNKKSITLVTRQRRKNGMLIDVQVDAHFFRFDNMEMNCAFVYDITERKKAEIALLESQKQIQTIFDAALDAIIIIDEEGKIVKWDSKSELLFGWNQDEVLGMPLTQTIIPHQHREAHTRGMKHFLKTGEGPIIGKTIEVRALNKNNHEFDISLSISPSIINGKYQFIGFIRDITSRKKAETELHDSEERYRQIVETAQEGIWLLDEDFRTTFTNKKLSEIFEYSPLEMMGKAYTFFMDEEGKEIAANAREARIKGASGNLDISFVTKSGKRLWANISVTGFLSEDKTFKGALAMVTDITKRKNDEELLQKSQLSLEKNNLQLEQKNKELEQFAYVASHDLQEPLRTITSFVQVFKQQYLGKLDSKSDKYLKYIVQASDRMRVLIKDLLDYSRIGHNKDLEQVDSAIILHDAIADIDKAIKDSHAEIQTEQLPVISGYTTELKQLFQNLILNSIKFRKKNVPLKINIAAQKKSDYWQFAFTDNGIGIDEQHNERIFIIFQRLHTRSEYQGSGIGLSHCKKIVELHHGKIWVESTPGEGSTFYFTIHSPKPKINEPKIKLYNAN